MLTRPIIAILKYDEISLALANHILKKRQSDFCGEANVKMMTTTEQPSGRLISIGEYPLTASSRQKC